MIFDCANGAAGIVIPDLIQVMQWHNAIMLYEKPDGTFPHHPADPVIEENMNDLAAAVRVRGAAVGIGFDGDADRMCAVTGNGTLVSGDRLLALFAKHIASTRPSFRVVYDVVASDGLRELLNTWGISAIMAPCGHANIREYMRTNDALLGGEISCHFFFEDRPMGIDDGIYAALRLIEALHAAPRALASVLDEFPVKVSSPRYRLDCNEHDKRRFVNIVYEYCKDNPDVIVSTLDGVRIATTEGWGLVRASNTQAALCFNFEACTHVEMQRVQRLVAAALEPVYPHNLYATFGV
jgi:phosphomannomutase